MCLNIQIVITVFKDRFIGLELKVRFEEAGFY